MLQTVWHVLYQPETYHFGNAALLNQNMVYMSVGLLLEWSYECVREVCVCVLVDQSHNEPLLWSRCVSEECL